MKNEALDAIYDAAREMIANSIRKCVIDLNSGVDLHDKEFRGAMYLLRAHTINYSKSSTGRGRDDVKISVSYSWQDPKNGKWEETESDLSVFSCDEMYEIMIELQKSNDKK